MGVSSKKTTTTQNSTQTTTPNNPSWITDPIQNLVGQIGGLGSTNPQNYVAPASGLQQQAFGQGSQTLGAPSSLLGSGADAVGSGMRSAAPTVSGTGFNAASLLDNLDAYVNPELNNVVRSSLDNYDQSAGATRAQYAAQGAKNGAFGGSRYALGESALLGDLVRGRATTESGLRSDAYDKAFNYSNLDADRRQQASMFGAQSAMQAGLANQESQNSAIDRLLSGGNILANIGNAQDASNRANIGLLSDLGGVQHGIEQSQATAPISLMQVQQALLSGLPLSQFKGSTTTGDITGTSTSSPSLLQGIGQGAQTAASLAALFSDRRLKENIERVGTRPDGLGVYQYNYVWSPERRVGVMADEVLHVKPEAVIPHESGFFMVDYGRL